MTVAALQKLQKAAVMRFDRAVVQIVETVDHLAFLKLVDMALEGVIDPGAVIEDLTALLLLYKFAGFELRKEKLTSQVCSKVKKVSGIIPEKSVLPNAAAVAARLGLFFQDQYIRAESQRGAEPADACAYNQIFDVFFTQSSGFTTFSSKIAAAF